MDNEIRFLYSVYPKKPIKNLLAKPINSPKTLSLTKEEVLLCMKCGTVYRRFGLEDRNERVTTINLDRLHNRQFITEEEWKKLKNNTETVVEEPVKVKEKVEEPVVEPTVEEPEIKEEVVKDKEVTEEVDEQEEATEIVEDTANTKDEVDIEETEEESEESDERGTVINTESESEISALTQYQYSNHKKKRRH